MAEFTKVMRDARRMCESFNSCPKCTLKSSKGVCGFEKIIENSCDESETKLIERKVDLSKTLFEETYEETLNSSSANCRRCFLKDGEPE